MYRNLCRFLSLSLALFALACSYGSEGQMNVSQNFSVFRQSPAQVLDALTAELVSRDALSADFAEDLESDLVATFTDERQVQFSSESVALGSDELSRLVPEEFRRFIGDAGGRYVLELTLEPAGDGGLRLTVTPTIIATVRGGEGPLGGRPLPSNGTLERTVLDALSRRLGG